MKLQTINEWSKNKNNTQYNKQAVFVLGLPASGKYNFVKEKLNSYVPNFSQVSENKLFGTVTVFNTNAMLEQMQKLKNMGYQTTLFYLDVNKNTCIDRDIKREVSNKSFIGESTINKLASKINECVSVYENSSLVDNFYVLENVNNSWVEKKK